MRKGVAALFVVDEPVVEVWGAVCERSYWRRMS